MSTQNSPAPDRRLDAVDLYRGVIMVIMLLDHTRDMVHRNGLLEDAVNPETSNGLLYFTRWITHLCAPGFVFLAGTGAGLQRLRGVSLPVLSRFLWTRGLWLMFMELFVVRTVMWFNVSPVLLAFLQVIFAIGVAMVVLAALVHLPKRVILAIGLLIVIGHNALDGFTVTPWNGPDSPVPSALAKLWIVLHQGGVFPIAGFPSPMVVALYPWLPWIGVMCVGYVFADIYGWEASRRRRVLWQLAIAMVVVFVALRSFNVYGDGGPWKPMETFGKSMMSFLNVQKYPPSLLFLLITLAPGFLALSWLDGRHFTAPLARAFVTFGRVPMFFYLLQWIWAHVAGIVVTAVQGLPVDIYFKNVVDIFTMAPNLPVTGSNLGVVYLCWLLGAIALYLPCRWYADVKARRKDLVLLRYL